MQVLVTEDVSNAGSCGGEEHGNEKPIAQNKARKIRYFKLYEKDLIQYSPNKQQTAFKF